MKGERIEQSHTYHIKEDKERSCLIPEIAFTRSSLLNPKNEVYSSPHPLLFQTPPPPFHVA